MLFLFFESPSHLDILKHQTETDSTLAFDASASNAHLVSQYCCKSDVVIFEGKVKHDQVSVHGRSWPFMAGDGRGWPGLKMSADSGKQSVYKYEGVLDVSNHQTQSKASLFERTLRI